MKLRMTFLVDVEKYKEIYGIDMLSKIDEIRALFGAVDKDIISVKIDKIED